VHISIHVPDGERGNQLTYADQYANVCRKDEYEPPRSDRALCGLMLAITVALQSNHTLTRGSSGTDDRHSSQ
jgi:hypothetical protein